MKPITDVTCAAASAVARLAGPLCLLTAAAAFAQNPSKAPDPANLSELRARIGDILAETHVPGAGIALVGRDGPLWIAGVGSADPARGKPATGDTLFFQGSIAKAFVSLSVLKLQEEGRLCLQDTLRSRAPEVEFDNPWEATDPVRIVHLLEHTSGWSDLTDREGDWNSDPEPSRRDALARALGSRTSRWKPGMFFSYSNLGPDVAAYLVEKSAGVTFEDYVSRAWFAPLGMKGASYFRGPDRMPDVAPGHRQDGSPLYPHFNILTRPAGGLVASPRDMAALVEFLLDRGTFRGAHLLPASAIDRMERPTSSLAAAEGLATGYGLGNETTVWRHWVFHGHGGSVPGASADFAYLPDEGVGYALMINGENGYAMYLIEEAVRTYLTRGLTPPRPPGTAPADEAQLSAYAGWYEPFTPRHEGSRYLESLLGLTRVGRGDGRLIVSDLTNGSVPYVREDGPLYRRIDDSRRLVLIRDRSQGMFFLTVGGPAFRRLPLHVAFLELGFAGATAILMLGTVVFAFFWLPKRLFGSLREAQYFGVRTDPLLATLCGGGVFALIWCASGDYFARANGALWSGGAATIATHAVYGAFSFFSIRGLLRAVRRRNAPMGRLIWWHCLATSLALAFVSSYLAIGGLRDEFGF